MNGVKSTWQSIVKENASQIFGAMASGIRSATSALNQMRPFLSGIATLISDNAAKLRTWVTSSSTAQNAFRALNTVGVQIFGDLLNAGGRFGDGLVSIFTQLMPLFKWSSQGFQNMAIAFQNGLTALKVAELFKTSLTILKPIYQSYLTSSKIRL